MKDQILKIAKVKSEKEFYKKYPTEEAFMKAHGKALEKAAMGKAMVNKQLKQLTDFGNPPIAQDGFNFAERLSDIKTNLANSQEETPVEENRGVLATLGKVGGEMAQDMMPGEFRRGGYIPTAQGGGIFNVANALGNTFNTPTKDAKGNVTGVTGGFGNAAFDIFGGKGTSAATKQAGQDLFKGGFKSGMKNLGTKEGLGTAGQAAGMELLNAAPQILNGIGQMKEQKNAINKADQAAQISGLTKQANIKSNLPTKNNFARPEDALVQPDQLGSAQGTGTNFLQMRRGGEIQNTYAPGTLYDDLGYEPLNDSGMKQYAYGGNIPTAEFGDYFQDSGQASIGKGVGSAIGSAFFGPLGGKVGGLLGTAAGNLLGGAKDANQLKALQDRAERDAKETAFMQGTQSFQAQNSAFMKQGGYMNPNYNPQVIAKFGEYNTEDLFRPDPMMNTLRSGGHFSQVDYTPPSAEAMFTSRPELKPLTMEQGGQMAMGGNLQTHWGGDAELMSYNPYIPGGGETVMFRGQSHDDTNGKGQSGIGITYGDNPVEVERGEPMTEMNDGGVVFGNMKIDKFAAEEINDLKAKGKKYKNYVADLSKTEAKQNKIMDKASKLALDADENDPFGRLSLNSSQASLIGANMKLKDIADKKQNAASVQNAILDTAEEYGLVSDDLAQGKIKQAKLGKNMKKAQSGYTLPEAVVKSSKKDFKKGNYIPTFDKPTMGDSLGNYLRGLKQPGSTEEITDDSNFDLRLFADTALSTLAPLTRPSNQMELDPSQLMGEYYGLTTNQLDPVQAQTFQPLLSQPYDVSYQDQLNEITAQSRAAERMMQNNPEAAANLFAQVSQAKNKVLADQFRTNQAQRAQTYDKNRELLNQAQLQNLAIYDKQYERQSQAKSNTKAQAQAALDSISNKIAKNKLENRKMGIMENMYNFRFDKNGRAINYNDPYQFNMSGSGRGNGSIGGSTTDSAGNTLYPIRNADGTVKGYTVAKNSSSSKPSIEDVESMFDRNGGKHKALNGSIVKSLKRI